MFCVCLDSSPTLGKPALERYFSHPKQVAILQMLFITNKVRAPREAIMTGSSPNQPVHFHRELSASLSCVDVASFPGSLLCMKSKKSGRRGGGGGEARLNLSLL